MGYLATTKWISRHPLCTQKLASHIRYLRFKIKLKIWEPFDFNWIADATLLAERANSSITINAFAGLYEFAEMGFLLHYLRASDTFIDVGANAGAYTVLASKVCRCNVHAFEPTQEAFRSLLRNIEINNVSEHVVAEQIAIGDSESDNATMTSDKQSRNHIVTYAASSDRTEEVTMRRLDTLVDSDGLVFKIDVEGFEPYVLRGAERLLNMGLVSAIIIETGGSVYAHDKDFDIHSYLTNRAFLCVSYDPLSRQLKQTDHSQRKGRNRIYIRDLKAATQRVLSAPVRRIHPVHRDL